MSNFLLIVMTYEDGVNPLSLQVSTKWWVASCPLWTTTMRSKAWYWLSTELRWQNWPSRAPTGSQLMTGRASSQTGQRLRSPWGRNLQSSRKTHSNSRIPQSELLVLFSEKHSDPDIKEDKPGHRMSKSASGVAQFFHMNGRERGPRNWWCMMTLSFSKNCLPPPTAGWQWRAVSSCTTHTLCCFSMVPNWGRKILSFKKTAFKIETLGFDVEGQPGFRFMAIKTESLP